MTHEFTINVPLRIPLKRVADLITSAFEGGSNYWYTINFDKSTAPKKICFEAFDKDDFMSKEVFRHIHWPISEGGRLCILDKEDDDEKEYFLDLPAIKKGMVVFAEKCPKHFGDFLEENDDATTGDCALQCMLFGEVVFG